MINSFVKGIGGIIFFGAVLIGLLVAANTSGSAALIVALYTAPFALVGALLAVVGELGENVAALRKAGERQTEILEKLSTSRAPAAAETKGN